MITEDTNITSVLWYEKLSTKERSALNMLGGALDLPTLDQYESQYHYLVAVYNRVQEIKSVVRQLNKLAGNTLKR